MKPSITKKTNQNSYSLPTKVRILLLRLIGLVLGAYIYLSFDIQESLNRLLTIEFPVMVVLITCCLASITARTLRWFLIIRIYSREPSFASTLKYQFIGIFWGVLTPGRIGETAKTLYFSKYDGLDLSRNLFIMFLDRFWELIGFLIANMIIFESYILYYGSEKIPFTSLLVIHFAVLLIATIAWVYRKSGLQIVGRFLLAAKMKKVAEKIKYLAADAHLFTLLDACKYIGVSLFAWLGYYMTYIIVARALNVPMLDIQVVVAAAIAAIAVMIPISIAGIGTRDAALISVFSIFGAGPVAAVSVSLSILGLNLLFVFIGMLAHQYEHSRKKEVHVRNS